MEKTGNIQAGVEQCKVFYFYVKFCPLLQENINCPWDIGDKPMELTDRQTKTFKNIDITLPGSPCDKVGFLELNKPPGIFCGFLKHLSFEETHFSS